MTRVLKRLIALLRRPVHVPLGHIPNADRLVRSGALFL
jgi:hypothetical protein